MKTLLLATVAALSLAACSGMGDAMPAADAVPLAAAAPRTGVNGPFKMTVQATGEQNGIIYLNSELDYRDQRNVSLDLPPQVAKELAAELGGDPREKLLGKSLRVAGVAQRVKIHFMHDNKPTDKYYYQTHIRVVDAKQIQVQ